MVSVDEMANNGLLFISNAAKAHNVCVKASQFVKKVLYVKIKESPEASLPVISKQIVNVYSKVILNSFFYGFIDLTIKYNAEKKNI